MIPLKLEAIAESLKKVGFETRLQKKSKEFPADILLVPVGMDDENKPFVLQIQHSTQDLSINVGKSEEAQKHPLTFITFLLGFPYEIPEQLSQDVMRMLFIANKALPLQGLGFSEPEKSAYFLFTYPNNEEKISETTLYGILGSIGFVVDNVAPMIRDLSTKRTTVAELLAD